MNLLQRLADFENEAHELFGGHEEAQSSRVIQLEKTYSQLQLLNLSQDDLFRQSLRCTEHGLFKAAHVMCWAAAMDRVLELIDECGMIAVQREYPKWPKAKTASELAEYVPERQLLEALPKLGLATKNQVKAFVSLLDRRNECAHPTSYLPELNETLGYITETLKRLQQLEATR